MVRETTTLSNDWDETCEIGPLKSAIAERIRSSIRESGGNAVVAEKSGVPLRTVGNYTTASTEPKIVALLRITKVCGVSLDWVATGEGDKYLAGPAAPLDKKHLAAAVQAVDELMNEKGLSFTPEKKTELILSIYDSIISDK